MLELVFTDWLPMGTSGRGSIHTWPMILKFIEQNERALIFIDEVDKAIGSGDWSMYIRLKLFSLLDHKIPENIELEDSDDEKKDDRPKRIALAPSPPPSISFCASARLNSVFSNEDVNSGRSEIRLSLTPVSLETSSLQLWSMSQSTE